MTLEQLKKKKLPDTPGVYFFLGPKKKILYIGKATSLRSRVRSYFASDLIDARGVRIVKMIADAKAIEFRKTDSVLEALILEANLIKAHKPHFNVAEKDDKSFNYVVITKEKFPRVLLVRGKELEVSFPAKTRLKFFGPFPYGLQLKEALRLVRRIFPYRDTCEPCELQGSTLFTRSNLVAKKPYKTKVDCKGCFNSQIGLCPGVCSGDISSVEYRKVIKHIILFFEGKKKTLLRELEKEMKAYAKEEKFEEAAERRKQMFALTHIQDVSLIKEELRAPDSGHSFRIEAYDVAHLMGGAMVGVMTVVENGLAVKAEYRKFKVRSVSRSNDTAALKEILSRRLGHDEWQMPKLIVVDGSTAQINTAEAVLSAAGVRIPVVGVVKDEKHRPKQILGDRELITRREKDILLGNAEAHRYAIVFHRKKMRLR